MSVLVVGAAGNHQDAKNAKFHQDSQKAPHKFFIDARSASENPLREVHSRSIVTLAT